MNSTLDAVDSKALAALMDDGRISWSDLAERLDLSAPAAAERVRRLEERGVITGYRAIPDPVRLGFELLAFVYVTAAGSRGQRAALLKGIARHPLILECHHMAGDDDLMLKVRCRSIAQLEGLLMNDLKGRYKVTRTRTTIALATIKETTTLVP
jgi:Lrp/AsnC family leucine-responsive transcriptional regulator